MQLGSRVFLSAALLMGVACHAPRPSLAESDPPPSKYNYLKDADFYGLVRRAMFNFTPASDGVELAQQSDAVVFGHIESVADGRTFLGAPENPTSVRTAVARVAVDEVIRGQVGSEVFVAFWRSQVTPVAKFRDTIPSDQLLLFLDAAQEQVDTHDALKGVDEGHTLFELVSPQGMAVGIDDGRIVQPLTDEDLWLFKRALSMVDLIGSLKKVPSVDGPASPLTEEQVERNLACQELVTISESTPPGVPRVADPGSLCSH